MTFVMTPGVFVCMQISYVLYATKCLNKNKSYNDTETVLVMWPGEPMTICEVVNEAQNNRKRWGNPATIESLSACTDAVSGRMVEFRNLLLTDTYDEAYLRAMGLDFTRMNVVTVASLICTIDTGL